MILKRFSGFLCAAVLAPFLTAEIRRVPADYATIKAAVAAARDGDTVEIGDGIYLEDSIVLDKPLKVLARRAFGATVYGSFSPESTIFIVRAPVEIGGLVLKNAAVGILQRDSPDVAWSGHDLAVLNMAVNGIAINAVEGNIGSADLSNIIVDACNIGLATNDARRLEVKNALIANCWNAICGSNHVLLRVDETVIWNCENIKNDERDEEGRWGKRLATGATSQIVFGKRVEVVKASVESVPEISEAIRSASRILPGSLRLQQAEVLLVLGDGLLKAGKVHQSEDLFRQALTMAVPGELSEIAWRSNCGLARVKELENDRTGAMEFYRRAGAIIERQIARLPPQITRGGYFNDKMRVYESLIRLLVHAAEREAGIKAVEEAFAYAEMSKARGFLFAMGEAKAGPGRAAPGKTLEGNAGIFRDLSAARNALQKEGLSQSARRMLQARQLALEAEYEAGFIAARRSRPGLDRLLAQPPASIAEIRAELPNDETAIVEYFVGEEASYAFWLTRRELEVAALPGDRILRPMIHNGLGFLSSNLSSELGGGAGLKRLFDVLLGPFRSRLKAVKRLIFVPGGFLFIWPFEALLFGNAGTGEGRFLIEELEVSYAPSATALTMLGGRKIPNNFEMDVLAVAAPHSAPVTDEVRSIHFPDLIYAEKEARDIVRHFSPGRCKTLLGPAATETALKREDLSSYRILHFATHAFQDEQRWWRSALLLTPDAGSVEDGRLDPLEIYDLSPRTELVMLAGCRTAENKVESGEGPLGITAAFLTAGATAVISSLWNVDDRSTARFMESFYRHLAGGSSKTKALKQAKNEMIRLPAFRHPHHWAPFILSGN